MEQGTQRCMYTVRLACTQTSAVSEHANYNETRHYLLQDKVKFIGHNPQWYTYRVKKEAIHKRLHPTITQSIYNYRDNGTEIQDESMDVHDQTAKVLIGTTAHY